jgi:hypothetical protein
MVDGRIGQNDEDFGSVIRHRRWPIGQWSARFDEVFSIANEHCRWLMGQ